MSGASSPRAGALLPHHQQLLDASSITLAVAEGRGYRSITAAKELEALGFAPRQRRVPSLLVPLWDVFGNNGAYQSRPDTPRTDNEGRPVKYETPTGTKNILDVHPAMRQLLG